LRLRRGEQTFKDGRIICVEITLQFCELTNIQSKINAANTAMLSTAFYKSAGALSSLTEVDVGFTSESATRSAWKGETP